MTPPPPSVSGIVSLLLWIPLYVDAELADFLIQPQHHYPDHPNVIQRMEREEPQLLAGIQEAFVLMFPRKAANGCWTVKPKLTRFLRTPHERLHTLARARGIRPKLPRVQS